MPILELSPRERSDLRAAAHALRPVVLIGDKGLSEAVLKEIDRALTTHGLIKVRAGGEERAARDAMLAVLCATLSCAAVHHLGKTFILFRPQPALAQRAALERPDRLKRRPSEPYTPKKLAAEGKTSKRRAPRPTVSAGAKRTVGTELNKAGKPARPSTRKTATANLGTPRRSGSALSLRAGARSSIRHSARPSKK